MLLKERLHPKIVINSLYSIPYEREPYHPRCVGSKFQILTYISSNISETPRRSAGLNCLHFLTIFSPIQFWIAVWVQFPASRSARRGNGGFWEIIPISPHLLRHTEINIHIKIKSFLIVVKLNLSFVIGDKIEYLLNQNFISVRQYIGMV